jgi:hypothetical protein
VRTLFNGCARVVGVLPLQCTAKRVQATHVVKVLFVVVLLLQVREKLIMVSCMGSLSYCRNQAFAFAASEPHVCDCQYHHRSITTSVRGSLVSCSHIQVRPVRGREKFQLTNYMLLRLRRRFVRSYASVRTNASSFIVTFCGNGSNRSNVSSSAVRLPY